MKWILLNIIFLPAFLQTCKVTESAKQLPETGITAKEEKLDFAIHVVPILEKKCSPCHFTGGKMFASMPFDQDTTIIQHESGILKRFSDDEFTIIKTFIEQNKNSGRQDNH